MNLYFVSLENSDNISELPISKPKLISKNNSLTEKQITTGLIKKSLSITGIKTSSWIINADIHNNLGTTFILVGDYKKSIYHQKLAISLNPNSLAFHLPLLFYSNYCPDMSAEEIFDFYKQYDERFGLPLKSKWKVFSQPKVPKEKLKIGYVSPDFKQHSMQNFLLPTLTHHDHQKFEVFAFAELKKVRSRLERHFRDMQDFEFTIEDGRLYMLQTRNGKRTGLAAVRIAVEMSRERLMDRKTALLKIPAESIDSLLVPVFDKKALQDAHYIGHGLAAGPGAASGRIVFSAFEAERKARLGNKVILVREETSPDDLRGMLLAQGILTARGGVSSPK